MARILVVDDNPLNANLARLQLERAGYAVDTVPGAQPALARLGPDSHDLVLTDISMPGMSGFDLLAAIRARTELSRLRVLAHTAFAMPAQHQEFQRAGFDAIVVKPASREALVRAVGDALAREREEVRS